MIPEQPSQYWLTKIKHSIRFFQKNAYKKNKKKPLSLEE
jgi:hypothetical protein